MIICANFVFFLILKTVVLQCHGTHSGLVCAAICVFVFISPPLAHLSILLPTHTPLPSSCHSSPLAED